MDEALPTIDAEPFRVTREQLKELVEVINCSARLRRSEIAPQRNGDPFQNEQVRREHWALVVDGLTMPNGSIYIENKYIDIASIEDYINSCLTALRAIRRSSHKFRIVSFQQRHVPINKQKEISNKIEDLIFEVMYFDRIVRSNLEQCYRSITGEPPYMGGYKKTKGLGEQELPARSCESPVVQFCLFLIALIQLRRLNGEEFTVNVLRNASSGSSSENDQVESLQETNAVEQLKPKPKGRPPSKHNHGKLRDEAPEPIDECSEREVLTIMYKDRRSSKLDKKSRKASGTRLR